MIAILQDHDFMLLQDYNPELAKLTFDRFRTNAPQWHPPKSIERTEILLLDEAFLLSALLFTILQIICQGVRKNFKKSIWGHCCSYVW